MAHAVRQDVVPTEGTGGNGVAGAVSEDQEILLQY